MHARLFAGTLHALGLDPTYGAYVDVLPGVTLATVNLMSLFGLHRRLRGAIVARHQATIALCPCGRSARKPFCDATHRVAGWRAESAARPGARAL